MKKTVYTLALILFTTSSIFVACSSPAQKFENAQNNVTEAKEDLTKAQDNYAADVEKFRKETNERIASNEMSIADFNARIAKDKKKAKADYKEKIEALEKKNTDMKKRMDDYKTDGREKWESFRREFKHDMDEIAQSLNDLTKNNVK